MRLIKVLFSGEFLFAALLLANVFKSALPYLPIDLNVILFILTVFIAIKRLLSRPVIYKRLVIPVVLFFVFIAIALTSLMYSSSSVYATEKMLILSTLTLWSFIGTFLLINNKESLIRFLKSFMFITIFISLYVLFDYFTSSNAVSMIRLGVDGGNALGLARAVSMGATVVIMIYLFRTEVSKYKKIFAISGLGILVIVLFLTGSRMPLISLVVVFAVFLLLKTFKVTKDDVLLNKNAVKVAFSIVPLPLLLIPLQDHIQTMIWRLSNLFNDSGFGSYTQRTDLYALAFDSFKSSPIFGNGLGSFAIQYNGIDERYYPHNIVLEVLTELGLISFIVFATIVVLPFFLNNFFKSDYLQVCVLLMFVYTFLNANTTGDINDNRMMLTFLALMYLYPYFNIKQREPHSE